MGSPLEVVLGDAHEEVLWDDSRFKVLDAGRGFGKTPLYLPIMYRHLQKPFSNKWKQSLPHKIWYIAPTYTQGQKIFWSRLKEFFGPLVQKKDESDLTLLLKNGAEISIKGALNPDNLRGPYLTLAVFDEFAFHRNANYWKTIIRPMLSKTRPYGEACFFSTPDGQNEFFDLFERGQSSEEQFKDWKSWHFTSLEGGFIDESEIEQAKYEMTEEEWRQEFFGEFLRSSKSVYYKFDKRKHCKPCKQVPGMSVHLFLDFNQVPSVHMGAAHIHQGKVYVFDEFAVGNTEKVMESFLDKYPKEKLRSKSGKLPQIYVYGDVSGQKSTSGVTDFMVIEQMLSLRGFNPPEICVTTINPLVKDRVNAVNTKLFNAAGQVGVYINEAKCPKLVRDLLKVQWTESNKLDKASDLNLTHISDAFGYFLHTVFPVDSPQTRRFKGDPEWRVINGYPVGTQSLPRQWGE